VAGYAGPHWPCLTVLYEVLAFVLPAWTRRNGAVGHRPVGCSAVLFLAGIAFAWSALAPARRSRFWLNYGKRMLVRADLVDRALSGFCCCWMVATGLAFSCRCCSCCSGPFRPDLGGNDAWAAWRSVVLVAANRWRGADPLLTDPVTMLLLAARSRAVLDRVGWLAHGRSACGRHLPDWPGRAATHSRNSRLRPPAPGCKRQAPFPCPSLLVPLSEATGGTCWPPIPLSTRAPTQIAELLLA